MALKNKAKEKLSDESRELFFKNLKARKKNDPINTEIMILDQIKKWGGSGGLNEADRWKVVKKYVDAALEEGNIQEIRARLADLDSMETVLRRKRLEIPDKDFNKYLSLVQDEEEYIIKECRKRDLKTVKKEEEREPEVVEKWREQCPPPGDTGLSYNSSAKIRLDGRPKKQRFLIIINGEKAYVRAQSFETALKLAIAMKTTDLGWVSGPSTLGGHENYHQTMRRLRDDLTDAGINVEGLIDNNGAKQYRFSLPRKNITIDSKMILRHHPDKKELIGELGDQ